MNSEYAIPNYRSLYSLLILGSFGFFTFSPVSSYITRDVLNLPLAVPELFFVFFYYFVKDKIDFKLIINKFLITSVCVLLLLLLISLIYQKFDLVSLLSTFRGYFYLVLSFSIFKRKNLTSSYDIMIISIGSVIGWISLSLSQFNLIVNEVEVDGTMAVYGNVIALSISLVVPIFYNLAKIQSLAILFGLILSMTSGIRRQIIIYIVSLVLSFILSFRLRFLTSFKRISVPLIFILILSVNYTSISEYFKSVSPLLHKRIFLKSESLVEGDLSDADQDRSSHFYDYFNSINDLILPHGFVSKRTNVDSSVGIYLDFPLLELTYTFGLFFLIGLFTIYLVYLIKCFLNFIVLKNVENGIWFCLGIVLLILIFIDGSFLHYAYITPFTGLVLAKVTN